MNIENSNQETKRPEKIPGQPIGTGPGIPSKPPAPNKDQPPRGKGRAFLAFAAVLLALAAVSLSGWNWWQARQASKVDGEGIRAELAQLASRQSVSERRVEEIGGSLDGIAANDPAAALQVMQNRLQADGEQLAALERAMAEQAAISRSLRAAAESIQARLGAAEAAVTGLSATERGAGEALDVAEVDYVLRLANERLRLFSDPRAADEALQVADLYLAAMNNPIHIGVRQEIAAARQALAAVETPDLVDVAGRLDAMQGVIPSLAFRTGEPYSEESAEQEDAGWWASLKGAFSGLVTVRRSSVAEDERVSLEDQDFIRQRLWLQFEMARLALMRQDGVAFGRALDRAAETLQTWFDTSDEPVVRVQDTVNQLLETPIDAQMPDITAPWNLLQTLRGAGNAVPIEPEQPAEPTEGSETG